MMSIYKLTLGLICTLLLVACGGGGGNSSAPTTTTTNSSTATSSSTAQVASILLSAPTPSVINADGSSSLTVTVRALDSSNGLVKGAVISLSSTGSSILGASSVTTDSTTGLATVTLTANPSDQSTRTAVITGVCATSCSAGAATLNAQINGATLTVSSVGGITLTAGGNPTTLNAVVKDASGVVMSGVPVTFTSTDVSVLGLGSSKVASFGGNTDSTGQISVSVYGLSASAAASISVVALGNAKSQAITVSGAVGTLAFSTAFSSSYNGLPQVIPVTVSAPSATTVNFSSTIGSFSPATVAVAGGVANSTLTVNQAGTASITAADNLGRTVSTALKFSPAISQADKIELNASQTTLGLAAANSTPFVRITARALVNATGQAVANVPIYFSMSGGPAAGEYLSPAYQVTDSSGNAYADFYSGTTASVTNGITVTASILSVATKSLNLTIGGSAVSVAFGAASVIRESTDKTLYLRDYSLQVTDANNNPVANAAVTLRLRPVAFSLGTQCSIATDAVYTTASATYCSEDSNENGSLDISPAPSEDGVRILTTSTTAGSCPTPLAGTAARVGTSDGLLTPQNSVAGSVPSTVTTDVNGIGAFTLTYLKAYSIWVVDKLTATISVNGTESKASTIFRLDPTITDVSLPGTCNIPNSPFAF